MCNIKEVADAAEMIVNGYAFTKDGETYIKWAQKSDNGFYGE